MNISTTMQSTLPGESGSFVLEDHGDDTYVELCLTATDEQGLEDQECVDLKPQEVTYTFTTVPGGPADHLRGQPL